VRVRRVVPIEDTPTSGWAKGVLTSDKINRSVKDIPTSAWSNVIGRLVISAHRRVISARVSLKQYLEGSKKNNITSASGWGLALFVELAQS